MTNYNERLDKILENIPLRVHPNGTMDRLEPESIAPTKQAITSLIKELVAEAKPLYFASPDKSEYQDGFNTCIGYFEQNLLKAMEEV